MCEKSGSIAKGPKAESAESEDPMNDRVRS